MFKILTEVLDLLGIIYLPVFYSNSNLVDSGSKAVAMGPTGNFSGFWLDECLIE